MDIEAVFYFTLLGALAASTAGFAVAWWGATRRARRFEDAIIRPGASPGHVESLDQTLRSLQTEVDQIRESHDFLSRLVADHLAKPASRRPVLGHVDTPR